MVCLGEEGKGGRGVGRRGREIEVDGRIKGERKVMFAQSRVLGELLLFDTCARVDRHLDGSNDGNCIEFRVHAVP